MPARILVIEDDETLALGLELNLQAEGYEVQLARDGQLGLELARDTAPDLLILDLMLPDLGGFEILSRLRGEGKLMPVIILTARAELSDKLTGFRRGADDYVTKPFSLEELVARVRAALGRPHGDHSQRVSFGEVDIDLAARRVLRAGEEVTLTAKEFDLLATLVRRAGRVQPRDTLLSAVWGDDYDGTARTVDNFIRSLRSKLEPDPANPRYLVTVRGLGYRFDR